MATNLVSGSGGSFKINNSLVPKQNYIVTTSGDKVSVSTVHGIFIPAQDYSEYNLNGSVANSAQEVEDWFSANGYLEMSGNGGEPTQWGEIEGDIDNQADLNDRFAPASHTHPFTEITGTAVAGQIPTLAISKVSGLQGELDDKLDAVDALQIGTTATTAKAGNYQPTWAQVTGKPTTFPPTQADILSYLLSLPDAVAGNILTVNAEGDGVEWVEQV